MCTAAVEAQVLGGEKLARLGAIMKINGLIQNRVDNEIEQAVKTIEQRGRLELKTHHQRVVNNEK